MEENANGYSLFRLYYANCPDKLWARFVRIFEPQGNGKQRSNGKIFLEEGLWYLARVLAINVTQYILVAAIFVRGFYFYLEVRDELTVENAKGVLYDFVDYFLERGVQEQDVVDAASSLNGAVAEWFVSLGDSNVVNYDCSGVSMRGEAFIDRICPSFLECQEGYQDECDQ